MATVQAPVPILPLSGVGGRGTLGGGGQGYLATALGIIRGAGDNYINTQRRRQDEWMDRRAKRLAHERTIERDENLFNNEWLLAQNQSLLALEEMQKTQEQNRISTARAQRQMGKINDQNALSKIREEAKQKRIQARWEASRETEKAARAARTRLSMMRKVEHPHIYDALQNLDGGVEGLSAEQAVAWAVEVDRVGPKNVEAEEGQKAYRNLNQNRERVIAQLNAIPKVTQLTPIQRQLFLEELHTGFGPILDKYEGLRYKLAAATSIEDFVKALEGDATLRKDPDNLMTLLGAVNRMLESNKVPLSAEQIDAMNRRLALTKELDQISQRMGQMAAFSLGKAKEAEDNYKQGITVDKNGKVTIGAEDGKNGQQGQGTGTGTGTGPGTLGTGQPTEEQHVVTPPWDQEAAVPYEAENSFQQGYGALKEVIPDVLPPVEEVIPSSVLNRQENPLGVGDLYSSTLYDLFGGTWYDEENAERAAEKERELYKRQTLGLTERLNELRKLRRSRSEGYILPSLGTPPTPLR